VVLHNCIVVHLTGGNTRLSLYHCRVNIQWQSGGLGGHVFSTLFLPSTIKFRILASTSTVMMGVARRNLFFFCLGSDHQYADQPSVRKFDKQTSFMEKIKKEKKFNNSCIP